MADEYGTTIITKPKKNKKSIREQLQSIGQNIKKRVGDFRQDVNVEAGVKGTTDPNLGISKPGTLGPFSTNVDPSLYMFDPTGGDAPTKEGFDPDDWSDPYSGRYNIHPGHLGERKGSKPYVRKDDGSLEISDTTSAQYVYPGDPIWGNKITDFGNYLSKPYDKSNNRQVVEIPGVGWSPDNRYWENRLKDIKVKGSSKDREPVLTQDGNKVKVSYKPVNPNNKIPYITNQLRTSKVGTKNIKDKVITRYDDIIRMSNTTADISLDLEPKYERGELVGYQLEIEGIPNKDKKSMEWRKKNNPSIEMIQQLLISFPDTFKTEQDVLNHYKKVILEEQVFGTDRGYDSSINRKVKKLLWSVIEGLEGERKNPHISRSLYNKIKNTKYKNITSKEYAKDEIDTKVQEYVISTYQNSIQEIYNTLDGVHPEYLEYVNNPTTKKSGRTKYYVSKVQEDLWNNLLVEAGMLESELREKPVSPEYEEYYYQYKQDNGIGIKNKIRGLIVNKLAQMKKRKK